LLDRIRIVKTTTVIFAVSIASKLAQILLFPLIAAYFGTNGELESFFVAFSIPMLMLSTLLGSFGMVFIPFFTEQRLKHDDTMVWNFASALITVVLLLSSAITVLSIICSPWLFSTIAPGMSFHYKELGIVLTRYLSVTILLFTGTVIFTAIMNSYQSFILPAVVGFIANIVIIVPILIVRQKITINIVAAAYVFSAASSAVILGFSSKAFWQRRYKFILRPHDAQTRQALGMFLTASCIGISGQMIPFANRYFASFLQEGSIATLEYASRIITFIVELLAVSIVIPLYQKLSNDAAKGDKASLAATFTLGIKMIAVVLLPAALFMVLLREPFFSLLLEHGRFTAQNSIEVSSAFLFLSLAMIGNGFAQIIVSIFYALKRTRLLFALSAGGVIINIALDALLYRPLGVNGLALATGVTAVLGAALAMSFLRKELDGFDRFYMIKFLSKISLLAFVSSQVAWITFYFIGHDVRLSHLNLFGKLMISAVICTLTYVILLSYSGVEEANFVLNRIKERFYNAKKN